MYLRRHRLRDEIGYRNIPQIRKQILPSALRHFCPVLCLLLEPVDLVFIGLPQLLLQHALYLLLLRWQSKDIAT